jgi:hypothetical protein
VKSNHLLLAVIAGVLAPRTPLEEPCPASKAVCTEGGNVISTQNLNHIVGLETYQGEETVNVEAGAYIWDIAEYLHPAIP